MCEFHYDYIKNKYGKNSRLLFTCLMYETKAGKNENNTGRLAVKNVG